MIRSSRLGGFFAASAFIAFVAWLPSASTADNKSDAKVKATATASKIGADGKQTVTITLEIAKDISLFANPVNHDFFQADETAIQVTARVKPTSVTVVYPRGRTVMDGKFKYDVYEGTVKIQANVQRRPGDSGPLEIIIDVHPHSGRTTFPPQRLKLTLP